ncbi:MAG: hypothetical protein ACLFPD_02895 [Desulfosudaceae bacterium]
MKDNPLFYTVSMARLCAAQGHADKSAEIYRYLLKNDLGNDDLRKALAAVTETGQADGSFPAPVPDGKTDTEPVPEHLQHLVNRWISLLVERDLKRRFDEVRHRISSMSGPD